MSEPLTIGNMVSRFPSKTPQENLLCPASRIATKKPPFETAELNKELVAFFEQPLEEPHHLRLIDCTWGVYAFFDYDGEPIYVGQSKEKLSGRIRRHLTNRRTDAVATSVGVCHLGPSASKLEKELGENPDKEGPFKAASYINKRHGAIINSEYLRTPR